jgi:MFS family permease
VAAPAADLTSDLEEFSCEAWHSAIVPDCFPARRDSKHSLPPDITWLILFRIILGFGIGGDYPVSATIMSE